MLLGIQGCVKELIPGHNGYKPSVVVWAVLQPDSTIEIITSGNRGIRESDKVSLSSVDFFLFEDSVQVAVLPAQSVTSDPLVHRFNRMAAFNKRYRLELISGDLRIASSVRTVSPLQRPDTIELSKGDNAILKYILEDPEGENNAYQFDVQVVHSGILTDTSTGQVLSGNYRYSERFLRYDEPSLSYTLPFFSVLSPDRYTFPVNDDLFDGKSKSFLFGVANPASRTLFVPHPKQVSPLFNSCRLECKERYILIHCRKISPEHYLFLVSENKNNGIFGTPYFNPGNVYSNIEGGLGLMSSVSERTDTLWVFR